MTYFEGFVLAVATGKKEDYRNHAAQAAPLALEFGTARHFEAWADDVSDGKVTDFRRAVKAQEGEDIVFAWFEYPDKVTRDSASQKFMSDPRMADMAKDMPFDGSRMLYGGFEGLIDEGQGPGDYTDGILVAVPTAKREAYRAMAADAAAVLREHGALRVVEAWGDDLPHGKVTDFFAAVQAQDDETVVFSFIEWPSKDARNAGWNALMQDPRMQNRDRPFDGKRMIWGGFRPILDTAAETIDA